MSEHKDCCTSGAHSHDYVPRGKFVQLTAVGKEAYDVGPSGSDKIILFCTDAFGHRFLPNQRLADTFAEAGFRVVVPDYFKEAAMKDDLDFSKLMALFPTWGAANPISASMEIAEKTLEVLKAERPAAHFAATGYCWGGKVVSHLLKKNLLSVGVLSHPSRLEADEAKEIPSSAHCLFNCAQMDQTFTPDLRKHYETTLRAAGVDVTFIDYPGTVHGFAVRNTGSGDALKVAEEARAKATHETIAFFKKRL